MSYKIFRNYNFIRNFVAIEVNKNKYEYMAVVHIQGGIYEA